jgi:hypothetical protein
MVLLVDVPGGTKNDGNNARRIFKQTSQSVSITGINKDLIHHFRVILETLSSGFDINLDAFE